MIRLQQILLTLLLSLSISSAAVATTILPIPLERLAQTAALIFYGTATSNEVKLDEISGRVATFTTFEIIEIVKGNTGSTHTIKQLGGQLPGSNMVHKVHGVPHFMISEKYVVFLPEESSLGFASPLGLSQGRVVVHENNGVRTVGGNQNAKASLNESSKKQTGTSLANYLKTVREMAAQ